MAHKRLYPRAELTVGGATKTVLEASCTLGYRTAFASLSARVLHTQGGFTGTELVRLALGYRAQSSVRAVAAGKLREDSIRWAPKGVSFSAAGPLAALQEATGIVNDAYTTVGDPTLPPEPDAATYALGWIDATDGAIIADILALYGIVDVNIADTGQRFATLAPAVTSRYAVRLASDRPGYDLIREIDGLTGCVTFDGPDGRVTRIAISGLPGGSPARTFAEGADFKGANATRQKSNDGVYNKVVVRGQGITDPTTGLAVPIEAERTGISPFVPTPPGYRQYPAIESDLIETEEFAGAIAARVLGEVNRRQETVTLSLTQGDSSLYPGMTVAVVSAALGLTAGNLYRIVECQHVTGAGGYQTTVVLVGGAASEGIDPNQKPVAALDYEVEIEGANGAILVLAALDSSGSRDNDGVLTGRVWDGFPIVPTPIGDGTRAVAVYSPLPTSPPPWVSVTVTDDHGKTATATRTITTEGATVNRRELWVAGGAITWYSPDGGETWHDYAVPTVVVAEQAGDAYQLGASAGGVLARILADGTNTAPSGPTGITALSISRDRTGKETGVAWASASDGRVWRSVDYGVSWAAVAPLPNSGVSHAIEESPYSPGDLYAGGGNILWHSYSAGASWEAFYTHPDGGMTLRRIASGVAAGATDDPGDDTPLLWIGFSGPGGAAPRVVERKGVLTHTLPAGESAPLDIAGLTITLDAERLFLVDVGTGGRAFVAPSETSGDLTKRSAYLPANLNKPRHAIRDGHYPVVWGASASDDGATGAAWKTTNEGATFYTVRPLPAYHIGYGRLLPGRTPIALTIVSEAGAERALSLWTGSANAAPPNNWAIVGFDDGAWGVSVAIPGPMAGPVPGSEAIWTQATPVIATQQSLFRRRFDLPAGQIGGASLRVRTDNLNLDVYVNGQRVGGGEQGPSVINDQTWEVGPLLIPGAVNVLAWRAAETTGIQSLTSFKLAIGGSA